MNMLHSTTSPFVLNVVNGADILAGSRILAERIAGRAECSHCGGVPVGSGCYHICPNSDHFYSPEQERADDPFYGDDDIRERYAGELIGLDGEDDIPF